MRATGEIVMAAVAEGTTYIDSGCSRSMFGGASWFDAASYQEDNRKIFLGDGVTELRRKAGVWNWRG